jgi:hypothetical protein
MRFTDGILIPRALTYGLCMEHLRWLPPDSGMGNEFIRYIDFDVTHVDIYTPVRVNDDGTITELLSDYDSSEFDRVRTAVDKLWGGGGERVPISKHAKTIKQARNASKTSTTFKLQTANPPHPHSNAAGEWTCEHKGCDAVDNLWLNLSTGRVLCDPPMMKHTWLLAKDESTIQNVNEHAFEHFQLYVPSY